MNSTAWLIFVLIMIVVISIFLRAAVDRFLARQLRILEKIIDRLRQVNQEKQMADLQLTRAIDDKERLELDIEEMERTIERRQAATRVLEKVQISFVQVIPRLANRTGEFFVLLGKLPGGVDEAGQDHQLLLVSGMSRQDIEEVLRSYPPTRGFQIREVFDLKRFRQFAKARVDARVAAADPAGLLAQIDQQRLALPAPTP